MTRNHEGIPVASSLDASLALKREGYLFVSNRCEALGCDAFRTRLMLRKVVCMRGAEAAREFYREGRMTRRGAMPRSTFTLLQDWGSVQTLDAASLEVRKAMFMEMMTREALSHASALFAEEWAAALSQAGHRIVLHDHATDIFARIAARWCGIALADARPDKRAPEFVGAIDNTAGFGPGFLRAQMLRRRSERWARKTVERVRKYGASVDDASPVARIAYHCGADGNLLPLDVAAVELLNLMRPITAIARFVTFAGHALFTQPRWKERLAQADAHAPEVEHFVQEVRRHYPFFPFVAGRVLAPFSWRDHAFARDDWVILDLYGTNHDPASWQEPERFRPERFADWRPDAYGFIPQGGGDFAKGHRCAGEWLTIALMKDAVSALARLDATAPAQDLSVPLDRLPTLPRSGVVLALSDSRPR